MADFLTVKEAAARLGCSSSLIQKKCKDGTIPSLRLGTDYRILWSDLELWLKASAVQANQLKRSKPESVEPGELLEAIDAWTAYLVHVRAFSPNTVELYSVLMRSFLKRMATQAENPLTIAALFERNAVMAVFEKLPPRSYSNKMNTYLMLRSFGSFLIADGKLCHTTLENLKPLKPRRQAEPRRTHLKPSDVSRLFDLILTRNSPPRDNLTLAAVAACMVYAGLRVSEVCKLKRTDVDLEARILTVRHGKGGKTRRVGISNALYSYLSEYNRFKPLTNDSYFLHPDGSPWDRYKVGKRMQWLSRRLGVDITCHGLRRTFATLAAGQGKSVNYLRIALGHTNLETTQTYLRTSEAEVVEAMKAW